MKVATLIKRPGRNPNRLYEISNEQKSNTTAWMENKDIRLPSHAGSLGRREAGVRGQRAQQVFLDLPRHHQVVVGRRTHYLVVAKTFLLLSLLFPWDTSTDWSWR